MIYPYNGDDSEWIIADARWPQRAIAKFESRVAAVEAAWKRAKRVRGCVRIDIKS